MDTWVPKDTLATRVLLVRNELKLNQRDFAAKCGMTFGELQSIEGGRQARGVDAKVAKIALAYNVDRDWLMWGGSLSAPDDPTGGGVRRQGLEPRTRWLRATGEIVPFHSEPHITDTSQLSQPAAA